MRLISAGAGGETAGPLTRSVRAAGLVAAGKGFKAESALVDQMELPNGVLVDQGLLVFPRSDWKKKKIKGGGSVNAAITGSVGEEDKHGFVLRSGRSGSRSCWARSAESRCW